MATSGISTLPAISDFDFLVGEWEVHNRRLRAPLTGDDAWHETDAVATSRTLHNGAISVDEMWYPEPGFAGCSFRTYDRARHEWAIYWVNSMHGTLGMPVYGSWENGVLVASGPDEYDGTPILARYVWSEITPSSAVWRQEFSADAGSTWELNWVMEWART